MLKLTKNAPKLEETPGSEAKEIVDISTRLAKKSWLIREKAEYSQKVSKAQKDTQKVKGL